MPNLVKAPPQQLPVPVAQMPPPRMPVAQKKLPAPPQFVVGSPPMLLPPNIVAQAPPRGGYNVLQTPGLVNITPDSPDSPGMTLQSMAQDPSRGKPQRRITPNAVPMTETPALPQEMPLPVAAAKPEPVKTTAMLELPPELPVPVAVQPLAVASGGRLGLEGNVRDEREPAAKTAAPPLLREDELQRPELPELPLSVWLPPSGPGAEVIEDFDRPAPSFAAEQPGPRRPANTVRAPLRQSLDAPPLPDLPGSIRTAS
jgi:hypothetical protein